MKKKYSLLFMLTLILLASAVSCFVTGVFAGRLYRPNDDTSGAAAKFDELLMKIGEVYIGEFNVDEVSDAAMHAAVDALGDRWSFYMTPEEYASYLDSANNRFAGIGVGIATEDTSEGVTVLYVYKGSAAEEAGIVPGDVITGIDGESILGIGIDDMRQLLSRPIGETAELKVLRTDGTTEILTVTYMYVFVDPVFFEMLDDSVGYIALANFDYGAAEGFISALDSLIEDGARAFIFDVRTNNGGRVDQLTAILDYLLPEGEIFITVDRNGLEEVTYSGPDMIDIPAVVLINEYSFSAAEYFAATLGEYGYAQSVGEQTTGKNRMQITVRLRSGGALHISSSQYLTKNRVSLFDAGGLTPDYPVPLTDEEFEMLITGALDKDDDPQLQKALSLLG